MDIGTTPRPSSIVNSTTLLGGKPSQSSKITYGVSLTTRIFSIVLFILMVYTTCTRYSLQLLLTI